MENSRQEVAKSAAGSKAPFREVFAWAMYDWANSAYSTILITIVVSYITDDVYPGQPGTIIYGWGLGWSMLVAAFLSPMLGAMADANGSKRRWLIGTAVPGAVASSLMFFATPDRPYLFLALFLIANLCFELSFGFYNAFLPEIADDENMGFVSGWGYGLGYVGGGLALVIAIGLIVLGDKLGLPTEDGFRKRLGLLLMGLWWGLFSLPTFIILRDKTPPSRARQPFLESARTAFREVGRSIRNVRSFRVLAVFLVGFLVFNDGVQTMISQASVFAKQVLHMSATELGMVVLMIQFIALPGSLLIGFLADRIGQKTMLVACLVVWIVILIAAYSITTTKQFWWMAAVAALVLGGTQSVSRSIMGLMTPANRTAEFFGFFNLSGRMLTPFGPILFTSILALTGDAHLAITSLLVFFVIGLLIIAPLNIARGQKQARASEHAG